LNWLQPPPLRAPHLVEPGNLHRIDDFRAERAKLAERAFEYRVDAAVQRRRVVGLVQDADARAL
jgi:hypothetical protein